MRILLLSNQPERTTRLLMFKATLQSQGQDVIVPKFSSRGWLQIAREARQVLQKEKPDVVHIFNVPDIIYHGLGKLKGSWMVPSGLMPTCPEMMSIRSPVIST